MIVLPFIGMESFAQSKKEIRKNNIKGVSEVITEYENGKESTHNDVSKKFDKEGEVIQEINYDKNGVLKEKILTKNRKRILMRLRKHTLGSDYRAKPSINKPKPNQASPFPSEFQSRVFLKLQK